MASYSWAKGCQRERERERSLFNVSGSWGPLALPSLWALRAGLDGLYQVIWNRYAKSQGQISSGKVRWKATLLGRPLLLALYPSLGIWHPNVFKVRLPKNLELSGSISCHLNWKYLLGKLSCLLFLGSSAKSWSRWHVAAFLSAWMCVQLLACPLVAEDLQLVLVDSGTVPSLWRHQNIDLTLRDDATPNAKHPLWKS